MERSATTLGNLSSIPGVHFSLNWKREGLNYVHFRTSELGCFTERTFGRSLNVRITSTKGVQVREMDAIETSNRRKCASREDIRILSGIYPSMS